MPRLKTKFALPLAAIALAALLVWWLWGGGHTPPGQPPLASLSQNNFSQLTSDFNASAGKVRLVLLLSPT